MKSRYYQLSTTPSDNVQLIVPIKKLAKSVGLPISAVMKFFLAEGLSKYSDDPQKMLEE